MYKSYSYAAVDTITPPELEIELFEGQARLGEGNLNLNPPGGGVGPPGGSGFGIGNHEKSKKLRKKVTKTIFSKIIY